VLAHLILPPGGPLLLLASALFLIPRRRRAGLALAVLALATLWICSTWVVGNGLLRLLEPPPLPAAELKTAHAIVVLGGGLVVDSPEYSSDVPVPEALARLRYAAQLARESALPILLAGGNPYGGSVSEARAMEIVLKDFGVEARWLEAQSATTAGNASATYALLAPEKRLRVVLVTSAWHMPRAERAFRRAGFDVVPGPTSYTARLPMRAIDFLPSAYGLGQTRAALWELLGILWYKVRGAI
jgi:uncharacterized SAM-binding protein YcdF (DUF218 family)